MTVLNVLQADALDFLRNSSTAVVATSYEDQPHATTVYFDIDTAFNFYYLTKTNTQKNIQTAFNPKVSLVVGFGPELITIQARGKAEILQGEDKLDAINRMIARFSSKGIHNLPIQSMLSLKKEHLVMFKIVPDEVLFMNMDSKLYPKSVSKSYHKIV